LVDSWAWIEYWSGAAHSDEAAAYIEGEEEAVVSAINLAEIYHWVLLHYDEKTAEEWLATVKRRCFVVPVGEEIAVEAARIRHRTKTALADSIILATAEEAGARILTGDPNFKAMRGVIYIGD